MPIRSYGEGSMIKGQTEPTAVKTLLADLPTAIRGLRAGKITPKKALLHPKLPDQDQVKRIYKEIESKDERLELNLYIIGENAEDEAEGKVPVEGEK
jgi:succinate dehydrogenase / fumarate reductase iron-sulfur subunit